MIARRNTALIVVLFACFGLIVAAVTTSYDLTAQGTTTYYIYLPGILNQKLPQLPPATPTLTDISNSDGDGNYTISWSSASDATSYELQEQHNSGTWNTIYTGSGTSTNRSGQAEGHWCYRIRASNAKGASPWSSSKCTTVDATPAGNFVHITSIGIQYDQVPLCHEPCYTAPYTTSGFTPELPGTHIHFFFDTVPPECAGLGPCAQAWFIWGGANHPSPFRGYRPDDRPEGATQLCALVANPDHTVQLNTGNCWPLPQ